MLENHTPRLLAAVVALPAMVLIVGCAGVGPDDKPVSDASGPSGRSDQPDTEEADLASLYEFLSHAGEAANAGDVEAEVNRFTADGIYMWPGAPAIEGRDALRKWFEVRFSEFEVELESERLELTVIGEWAFERGRDVARIRPKTGRVVQTVRGKYLNILRRQADGTWRIARRIRNADHPTRQ